MGIQTHYDQTLGAVDRAEIQDQMFNDAQRMRKRGRVLAIDKELLGYNVQLGFTVDQLARAEADYLDKTSKRAELMQQSAKADIQKQSAAGRRPEGGKIILSQQEKQRQVSFLREQKAADEERQKTLQNIEATDKTVKAAMERLQAEKATLLREVEAPYRAEDEPDAADSAGAD